MIIVLWLAMVGSRFLANSSPIFFRLIHRFLLNSNLLLLTKYLLPWAHGFSEPPFWFCLIMTLKFQSLLPPINGEHDTS
jgi:hypothetical protein